MTEARSELRVDEVHGAHARATVLTISGELDLATISAFKDAVTAHLVPDAQVVLDLAELMFCDSTGLGALVGLHRLAASSSAGLLLAAPRRRLADLFALSGIDQVIPVYTSRQDALSAPAGGGIAAPIASADGPAPTA